MLKVGITGNIGSGKTTVSRIFELLGVPVFYADTAAKNVMINDAELIAGVKKTFGDDAYLRDGTLNRKYLAGIVFSNETELSKLNALVHPAVFRSFDDWAQAHHGAPYVIKEAAILFESGSYKMCNRSLLVTAPFNLRMQRIIARDKITFDEAAQRDAKQFAEEIKLSLADDVIVNDDTKMVIPQVLKMHQFYLTLA